MPAHSKALQVIQNNFWHPFSRKSFLVKYRYSLASFRNSLLVNYRWSAHPYLASSKDGFLFSHWLTGLQPVLAEDSQRRTTGLCTLWPLLYGCALCLPTHCRWPFWPLLLYCFRGRGLDLFSIVVKLATEQNYHSQCRSKSATVFLIYLVAIVATHRRREGS
jgi:hypothetical protein